MPCASIQSEKASRECVGTLERTNITSALTIEDRLETPLSLFKIWYHDEESDF